MCVSGSNKRIPCPPNTNVLDSYFQKQHACVFFKASHKFLIVSTPIHAFQPYTYKSINCKRLKRFLTFQWILEYSQKNPNTSTFTKICWLVIVLVNQPKILATNCWFLQNVQNQWIGHCSVRINTDLLIFCWFGHNFLVVVRSNQDLV